MAKYTEMGADALRGLLDELQEEYRSRKSEKLNLNMARGVPGADQLDFSNKLLSAVTGEGDSLAEDGTECRNYGVLDGIPEAKRLLGMFLGVDATDVFVGGNSSLNMMHDTLALAYMFGLPGSEKPWCRQEEIKFLCPSPGYDRHFAVTQHLGFTLLCVPMTNEGPDLDVVEELVKDATVKGMWCIPKYSNPTGITYSGRTVRRLASLRPAAKDFRLMWDNAYSVHDLDTANPDKLLNLMDELKENGNEELAFQFTSTSKIAFPGAGIAAMATGPKNMAWYKGHMALQSIGFDKLNQLRHARLFPDIDSVRAHMAQHAEKLRPKFDVVNEALEPLVQAGTGSWNKPNGGYFISLDVFPGTAKRTVELCAEAGVLLTPAGSTFPYGKDPEDKNIRIAPTSPPLEELRQAASLLCLCARIAAAEKLLEA